MFSKCKAGMFLCVMLLGAAALPAWTCSAADMPADAMDSCGEMAKEGVQAAMPAMDCCQVSVPVEPGIGPRAAQPTRRIARLVSDLSSGTLAAPEVSNVHSSQVPRSRHAAPLDSHSALILRI